MLPNPHWLRASEETNALDHLRKVSFFAHQTESDEWAWKWLSISLHGALYGFSISVAKGTDSLSVVKNGHLIPIWEALNICKELSERNLLIQSSKLVITNKQNDAIKLMTSVLRNEFMHFQPKSWSISLLGLPNMVINIVSVIHWLALESGGGFSRLSEKESAEIKSLCSSITHTMKSTSLYTFRHQKHEG